MGPNERHGGKGSKWVRRLLRIVAAALIVWAIVFGGIYPVLKWLYPLHYEDIVAEHAQQYDVDPLLITAIMFVESSFDPHAVSRAGARGLMQIMPDTGVWAAESMGMGTLDVDSLFEPSINIEIGIWYLTTLRDQFGGSLPQALAAYNGGRTNVLSWLDREIWSGDESDIVNIPFPETREYVRKVLATYERYDRIWRSRSIFGSHDFQQPMSREAASTIAREIF